MDYLVVSSFILRDVAFVGLSSFFLAGVATKRELTSKPIRTYSGRDLHVWGYVVIGPPPMLALCPSH